MNDSTRPEENDYAKLEAVLREQLRKSPDMHLTRLMLLELYFKTGSRKGFVVEAQNLFKRVGDPTESLEWQRCAAMGRTLDPEEELYRQGSNELLMAAEAATVATNTPRTRRIGEQLTQREAFEKLEKQYESVVRDPKFLPQLDRELIQTTGRPSSLLHLRNLSKHLGGAQIYLKREDQMPRDTHLTMMVVGQTLLARQLGCTSIVTSTTNGHRGLLVASMAARYNMACRIFMGAEDRKAYVPRVFRMSLMNAEVVTVPSETPDVRQIALEYWAENSSECMMVTGLDAMHEPYPAMHRDFITAIGRETSLQVRAAAKRPPSIVVARGRDTADALGLFPAFTDNPGTRLVCVDSKSKPTESEPEADTAFLSSSADHPTPPGALEGLSYPSVVREHQWLNSISNVEHIQVGDDRIVDAATDLARFEGITVSRQTARIMAWVTDTAPSLGQEEAIVVMLADNADDDLVDIGEQFAMSLESATKNITRR